MNDQSNNNETKVINALFSSGNSGEKKPRSTGGRRYNRSGRSRKPAAPANEASSDHLGLVLTAAENQSERAPEKPAKKAAAEAALKEEKAAPRSRNGRGQQRRSGSRTPKGKTAPEGKALEAPKAASATEAVPAPVKNNKTRTPSRGNNARGRGKGKKQVVRIIPLGA